ncbi:MAG: carbon-nitrogen hydrolase family protein [bacterium]|nr:carbon-nitrogen hydrolase family protein [bacterium]
MKHERKTGPRRAAVGTCILRQQDATSPEDLLDSELAMVDKMAWTAQEKGWQLDLAVLPEVSFKFVKDDVSGKAEELDGPRVRAFAERARRYSAYVTAPVVLRHNGKPYNSMVLLDRNGASVGVYDKAHPVLQGDGSLDFGSTPGTGFPIFDVDFGRIGIQICWDVAFAAGWQAMANQDAELVLFPTNPASMVALRGYAWQHGYYIVPSTVHPPSGIVDPLGRVIANLSEDREVQVVQIDLDYRVIHSNCMWAYRAKPHPEYDGRIQIDWDPEAHAYLATSLDPTLPIRTFMQKERLLTGRQRMRRNIELLEQEREGLLLVPPLVERE